jgi:hypothetical protein
LAVAPAGVVFMCKLRGAKVMEGVEISRYHTPTACIDSFGGRAKAMAEAEPIPVRTSSGGRPFVCEAHSPDGWHVQVFGPSARHHGLYADARHPQHGVWCFPLGRELAGPDRIDFRWDLPNGSWGVYIDGDCWAVCAHRPAQRMGGTASFRVAGRRHTRLQPMRSGLHVPSAVGRSPAHGAS